MGELRRFLFRPSQLLFTRPVLFWDNLRQGQEVRPSRLAIVMTALRSHTYRLLAICGGQPRFATPRHVGAPTIPDRRTLHARIDEILDTRRLTNDGPFVKEFEARLGRLNGDVEVVAVCNATVGMQMLFKALDLRGEVILPSFTFVATAHACLWEGLEPVFADVERGSHTLDPACVARQVGPETAAIVGVHLWGRMCRIRELEAIARDRDVPLVFDAAHALGCTHEGVPMGRLGTASVVSFHATKFVQSLEGGAILTADRALADRLRLLRNFGFQGFDNVVALGTNAKMNDRDGAGQPRGARHADRDQPGQPRGLPARPRGPAGPHPLRVRRAGGEQLPIPDRGGRSAGLSVHPRRTRRDPPG
ncbi:MAG: hypothetical protein EBR28_02990 [Planctomycetia bacterium]|nr:hypothetical protein [Planctomycetia bacterium]